MSDKTYWAVEMVAAESGDAFYEFFDNIDSVANFVRVNAGDAGMYRISAVTADVVARSRIDETFRA